MAKVVQVGETMGFQVSQESRSVAGAESSAAGACCGLGLFSALQSLRGSSPSLFVFWLMVAAAAAKAAVTATAATALRSLSWEMSDEGKEWASAPPHQ